MWYHQLQLIVFTGFIWTIIKNSLPSSPTENSPPLPPPPPPPPPPHLHLERNQQTEILNLRVQVVLLRNHLQYV